MRYVYKCCDIEDNAFGSKTSRTTGYTDLGGHDNDFRYLDRQEQIACPVPNPFMNEFKMQSSDDGKIRYGYKCYSLDSGYEKYDCRDLMSNNEGSSTMDWDDAANGGSGTSCVQWNWECASGKNGKKEWNWAYLDRLLVTCPNDVGQYYLTSWRYYSNYQARRRTHAIRYECCKVQSQT